MHKLQLKKLNMNNYVDIDENFAYCKLENTKIIIMKSNGYINATKLGNQYNEKVKNWFTNKSSKKIISGVKKLLNGEEPYIMRNYGINKIKGTYVHPYLLTDICRWISADFSIKVSSWIEEWKSFSEENYNKYYTEISQIKPDNKLQPEAEYQQYLHEKLGGEIEVETQVGRIDLLTHYKLIEIKKCSNWKCGLGQLIAYGKFYPDHKKYLYLFGVDDDITEIKEFCRENNVHVRCL